MDTVSIWGSMVADLATIRVADGAVKRLALKRPLFWYNPSPDGKWLAFSRQSAIISAAGQPMYDYEVVPLTGGEIRTVVRRGRAGDGTASWSPDGKTLAYIALGPMVKGDIFLVDVEAGRERQLTTAPHPTLMAEGATPYWSPDGRTVYVAMSGHVWKAPVDGNTLSALTPEKWGPRVIALVTDPAGNRVHSTDGGRTFTVTTIDRATKNIGFYRVDAATGAATKLREEPRGFGGTRWPAVTSKDGSTIVYLTEDGQHPPDVWGGSADLANPKQLTTLNPEISHASLGKTRVIDYIGIKGEKLQGVLLYPGNYE
jgi:Tol biopolymer transport system component